MRQITNRGILSEIYQQIVLDILDENRDRIAQEILTHITEVEEWYWGLPGNFMRKHIPLICQAGIEQAFSVRPSK